MTQREATDSLSIRVDGRAALELTAAECGSLLAGISFALDDIYRHPECWPAVIAAELQGIKERLNLMLDPNETPSDPNEGTPDDPGGEVGAIGDVPEGGDAEFSIDPEDPNYGEGTPGWEGGDEEEPPGGDGADTTGL